MPIACFVRQGIALWSTYRRSHPRDPQSPWAPLRPAPARVGAGLFLALTLLPLLPLVFCMPFVKPEAKHGFLH